MNIAVKVRNLTVQFNGFIAVKNVSFTVKKGEIFGFLGANGAGKTTTIRVFVRIAYTNIWNVFVSGVEF